MDYINLELEKLIEYANNNDKEAISALAFRYSKENNEEEIFKWCKKGAELNIVHCIYVLGYYYYNGCFIEKDEKEAFKYFLKASKYNHADALYHLRRCYAYGIGVKQDKKKAFKMYCSDDSCWSLLNVGVAYLKGVVVKENKKKAYEYFNKALEVAKDYNKTVAYYFLGNCYLNEYGVKKDEEEAFKYYKLALENENDVCVQYLVGSFYEKTNKEEAFKYYKDVLKHEIKWYEKTAFGGDYHVQYLVALYNELVNKNHEEAMKWYSMIEQPNFEDITKAAQYEDVPSMQIIALCSEYGKNIDKNFDVAFDIYKKLSLKASEWYNETLLNEFKWCI